jgi:hypothetical protein
VRSPRSCGQTLILCHCPASDACGDLAQDKRSGEAGYEARLQRAEEHVSSIAAAAEARSQAKMLAEVERYKARPCLNCVG